MKRGTAILLVSAVSIAGALIAWTMWRAVSIEIAMNEAEQATKLRDWNRTNDESTYVIDRVGEGDDKMHRARMLRAWALLQLDRKADAKADLAHYPDDAEALAIRALVHRRDGDLPAALADATRSHEIDPQGRGRYELAQVLSQLKRYGEALALYDAVLEEDADDVWALTNRASVLLKMERNAEALPALDRALELDPEDAISFNNRAWARFRTGALDGALTDINRSIEMRPDAYASLDTRCWILVALGEPHKARPDCVRAVELGGGDTTKGMVAWLADDPAGALEHWSAALAERPHLREQLAGPMAEAEKALARPKPKAARARRR